MTEWDDENLNWAHDDDIRWITILLYVHSLLNGFRTQTDEFWGDTNIRLLNNVIRGREIGSTSDRMDVKRDFREGITCRVCDGHMWIADSGHYELWNDSAEVMHGSDKEFNHHHINHLNNNTLRCILWFTMSVWNESLPAGWMDGPSVRLMCLCGRSHLFCGVLSARESPS